MKTCSKCENELSTGQVVCPDCEDEWCLDCLCAAPEGLCPHCGRKVGQRPGEVSSTKRTKVLGILLVSLVVVVLGSWVKPEEPKYIRDNLDDAIGLLDPNDKPGWVHITHTDANGVTRHVNLSVSAPGGEKSVMAQRAELRDHLSSFRVYSWWSVGPDEPYDLEISVSLNGRYVLKGWYDDRAGPKVFSRYVTCPKDLRPWLHKVFEEQGTVDE